MKNLFFTVAFIGLATLASLQFSKPDYVFSAAQVNTYSMSFLPQYKIQIYECCNESQDVISTGLRCITGTRSCSPGACNSGTPCGYYSFY